MFIKVCLGFVVSIAASSLAAAAPPIEAYGQLPAVRAMAISPDGAYAAYLKLQDGNEILAIYNFASKKLEGARINDIKARSVDFAGPSHVILHVAKTTLIIGYVGKFDNTAAFSYGLKTGKIRQLLSKMEGLYPAQSGLGDIIGLTEDGDHVVMPAYTGPGPNPPLDLIRVDLDSGRGLRHALGNRYTTDWIVDHNGEPIARADYDNISNRYRIFTRKNGDWLTAFDTKVRLPLDLVGVEPGTNDLIVAEEEGGHNHAVYRRLSLDGHLSDAVFEREDADIENVLINLDHTIIGVEYSGFSPTYKFIDQTLNASVAAVNSTFRDSSVTLLSWTDDYSRLVFFVEGGKSSGDYYVFDAAKPLLTRVASARPDIGPDDIGRVLTIEYSARDGLKIPALLTLPTNDETKNLPLIVMPHGGPESHDSIGFDWMAQFFASRGYLVFQPNFRGSDGFGIAFRNAGRGEWGHKMQDDITDGVTALIKSGRADPKRICIVGASYGGYAALAGGAFTPELYKCVAAIAPVSDLPDMISWETSRHDSGSWVVDYWKEVMGDPSKERAKLESISPSYHADAFRAPVLLIHGKDDTTVPISQSTRMEAALKKAGKEVTLIKLNGEDHHLSKNETRLETLKALAAFVQKEIGGE